MNRPALLRRTHRQSHLLTLANPRYRAAVESLTWDAFLRDRGEGDLTTELFFEKSVRREALVIAKEKGVLAGVQEVAFFLRHFKKIRARFLKRDGEVLKKGDGVLALSGDIRELLAAERVILNVLGRMSGIANYTSHIVEKARKISPQVMIVPTRKTLWELLDKRACSLGGGGTHRLSLDNALLIKHNHLNAAGGEISEYIEKVAARAGDGCAFIEIEVGSARDAMRAAEAFIEAQKAGLRLPCFIMFDNMTPREIRATMGKIKSHFSIAKIYFEASGRINEKNISAYAKSGVDVLSLGALTHSAPMLDVSMRIR